MIDSPLERVLARRVPPELMEQASWLIAWAIPLAIVVPAAGLVWRAYRLARVD